MQANAEQSGSAQSIIVSPSSSTPFVQFSERHVPFTQLPEHGMLHPPQCWVDVLVEVSHVAGSLSQSAKPGSHMLTAHAPPSHEGGPLVFGHGSHEALAHPSIGSLFETHIPSQSFSPDPQVPEPPAVPVLVDEPPEAPDEDADAWDEPPVAAGS